MENFLSIEEADLDLDNRGLILIEGVNNTSEAYKSNGTGKTSYALESILYALYDTTSKGLKADEVVNRKTGKNTVVTLEGIKGEDTYRIERYRKHSKNKNKVKLFLNDKEITEKSAKDTNQTIENIVGIDYNTFISSIIFSQGAGGGAFASASDKEKKDILENLVNMDIYAKAQEVAKERVKEKENEISGNERDTEKLNWELENVDNLERQDKENYEKTEQMLQQEFEEVNRKTEELNTYVRESLPEVERMKEKIEETKQQRDEVQNNFNITQITQKMNEVYQRYQEVQNDLQSLYHKKDEVVQKYKKLQSETHCPVCGNELDQEHREKEMNTLKGNIRKMLVDIQSRETEYTEARESYQSTGEEYAKQKEQYDNINSYYMSLSQQIQEYETTIQNYENKVQEYKNGIQSTQNTINRLNQVPKPQSRDSERETIREKIKAHKEALLTLEREKTQLENVVKVYSNSGVKSHVLDLVTPYLNERANKYVSYLSGSDIEIEFSTQKQNKDGTLTDKFDVQVMNNTGGSSYKANSEGEKKRIDLSISLAIQDLVLQKASLTTNFIVYDEVFDALDSVGAENVITLLRDRLESVGSIFTITHNDSLKDIFEQVITVTKGKDGVSRVTDGTS